MRTATMSEAATTLEAADIATILKALPHRYPFLMVDRIINMRGDESAIGIKNVTAQRAAVPRAFSRQSGISRRADDRGHGADRGRHLHAVANGRRSGPKQVYFLTIDKAKFRKPVLPGDTIEYHMTKIARKKNMWWFRGEADRGRTDRGRGRSRRHARRELDDGTIDPTARIEPGATIGHDVSIGPYCVIGPHVVIGDGCRLVAHVHRRRPHHDRARAP